jgi:hypothetical protein
MAGYIRQDTTNNIADGNIINAVDFDNEYNAIESAFNSTTGHTHDGTSAEGAPITKVGPAQDVVVSTSSVTPKTDNVLDIGSSLLRFKDLWLSGNASVAGTLGVTGLITASGGVSGALTSSNVTVTGGSINGTTVGATTASTGAFTTLSSNSTTTLNGTTIPASVTLVSTAATQTLTNKTLTSPVISTIVNTGTLTLPTSTDTLVGRATTDTLTNKTLTSPTISGGTLNNISIGATTASTGAFTNLAYTGTLTGGTGVINIGSGQLYKDASGNVGIGTSAPAHQLDISGISGTLRVTQALDVATAGLNLYGASNQGNLGRINIWQETTGAKGGFIRFDTCPTGTNTFTERMRIDSAGNVGIGTSSPTGKLNIVGSESNQLILQTNTTNSTIKVATINAAHFTNSEEPALIAAAVTTSTANSCYYGGGWAGSNAATNLFFYTAANNTTTTGTERMRIDSAGNVGIGTSSPARLLDCLTSIASTGFTTGAALSSGENAKLYQLQVNNTVSSNTAEAGILLAHATTDTAQWGISVNRTGGAVGSLIFRARTGSATSAERMRIDSAGNVGIGTSSPAEALHVARASGSITTRVSSGSLADNQICDFRAVVGGKGTAIGLFKHSGITDLAGYMLLPQENGTNMYYWTDNSGQFRLSTTATHIGTTSGTVVGTQTSDERIKNVLGPVEYGLSEVLAIEPVKFALKSDPDQTAHLGFIAQQVNGIVPESVFDTKEKIVEGEPTKLGMEYVALIPVLVNAIKEQQAIINDLKARLDAANL